MPFGCRNIEPSRLGAHEVLQTEEEDKNSVLFTVANNAIVGTLLQLSSLVRHADDLFCDLSDECQKVFERTDSITKRLKRLDVVISKLDAKQVTIPEGDLKQFTSVTSHHEAKHGYDANFFLHTNRPQCVQDLYNLCAPNPTKVIRSADLYRKDGLSGSKMFKCWPILMNEQKIRTPDLNMPRSENKIKRVRSFEKKYKPLRARERPKTIHGLEGFNLDDMKAETSARSNSAENLASTEPPVVVSIDTSGSNFERMQSQRSSGRRYQTKEEKEKKKRRRRTVTGVENIMSEIERFDRRQKVSDSRSRHTPRSYSFDGLDADDDTERDEAMLKYLDEIDGKMEERMGEERAQRIMKFFPCRRSRSLPRCIKLTSVARSLSADRKSQKDFNTTYGSSSLSIPSLASSVSSRLSRSTKRSSIIGNKIKSLVSGKEKAKQRPKSLDIDTFLDSKAKGRSSIEEHERSKSTYSLERNPAPQLEEVLPPKNGQTTNSNSTIGPGSYYNFESSTLPRAQAKKYDFPWESLPKDWTTSVKLREISKRRAREDRQSSSGNWSQSGTSSNRHSLDSDLRSEGPAGKFTSQYSLGKDSGRDSLTLEEEQDCATDGTSTAGYAADSQSIVTADSVSIGNPKADFTELDTQAWIQSLAIRAAREEADKSSSLSRLTRQNILALDLMLADGTAKVKADEESSIYSVDQEGFYTSFHTDSGLKKSTNTLVDEDCDFSPSKDSASVCSADSVIHRSSGNEKFAGIRKGSQTKVLSKVTPPAPPQRTSSAKSSDGNTTKVTPELHSFPSQDSSSTVSESDAEAVFTRVQNKTNISSTGFPSLVALSTSDDESSPENRTENRQKGLYRTGLNQTGSDLGLSNITCASQFSTFSQEDGSFVDSFNSSSASLKHSKSVLECTNKGFDTIDTGSPLKQKSQPGYQSWPRSHKIHHTGILKTPEKQFDIAKPPKTLNFAPVVNLFKEGTVGSLQIPLPSPTNSSCSESSGFPGSGLSSFQTPTLPDQSYNLSVPVSERRNSKTRDSKQPLPLKYQPVITVTPRSRSRSGERKHHSANREQSNTGQVNPMRPVIYAGTAAKPSAQSTPLVTANSRKQASPSLYAVSPVMAPRDPSRQNSNSSTSTNGSNYMDMQSMKSAGSQSSLASSECLNFTEDHSNYMTMSSPSSSPNLSNIDFSISSTPSGSMDSLLDRSKTPTNELESDTYQINTNLHANRNSGYTKVNVTNGSVVHGDTNGRMETVPIVTRNGNQTHEMNNRNRQSFGSFRKQESPQMNSSGGKFTPGRRSLDSTRDLTNVTPMSINSSLGMSSRESTPVNQGSPATGQQSRQVGRQSRADMRREPSYRNLNASNRRSLPSDMNVQIRHVPLNDNKQGVNSNQNGHQPQKSLSSSRSYPSGFTHSTSGNNAASSSRNGRAYTPETPPGGSGDQVSSRSDSYRVAMGNNKSRTGSYRNAVHPSKSYPVLPPTTQSGPYRVAMDMSPNRAFGNSVDDDVLSRADSYRIAVRNTQGLVPDMGGRNSSYRVAMHEDMPVIKSKLDALGMDNSRSSQGRDQRRMGITDVDQVKDIKPVKQPVIHKSMSAPQVQMRNRDTRSAPQSRNDQSKSSPSTASDKPKNGRIRKVTDQDLDPIDIVQTVDNNNDSRKSSKNNPNRSSTYIQFDPIFEDGDEDLCPPNAADLGLSSLDYSKHLSNTSRTNLSLINGTVKDANANNVKSAKSAKSAKNSGIEMEDSWRFSQV